MKTVAEIRRANLKRLTKEFGSSRALAEHLEKSPSLLSQWINGSKDSKTGQSRGLSEKTARYIESKCHKSRGWLDSLDLDYVVNTDETELSNSDQITVPLFIEHPSDVPGRTVVVLENKNLAYLPNIVLLQARLDREKIACCNVSGDSMHPVLPNGTIVCIDLSSVNIIDGSIYALDQDGMLRIKQLFRVPEGIKLRSFNRDYEDELITMDDLSSTQILGRIAWGSVFFN